VKALVFDKTLEIKEVDKPSSAPGEAVIRVAAAGICNTDIEITRGYIRGFRGIPGHEFFGHVEAVADPAHHGLVGKRVTSEINCACNRCSFCLQGLQRHCPNRTVIGIDGRNGVFAEYVSVPEESIVPLPDSISDGNAIFIEPLAAALEIPAQIQMKPGQEVLVIGDGKLAHLIAHALNPAGCKLKVLGRHPWKASLLRDRGIDATVDKNEIAGARYDVVIEASGSPAGFDEGLAHVKPRGTFVLKSTYAGSFPFNPAAVVVNELTLLGSRCGRFGAAIEFLERERIDLSYLISRRFPLGEAVSAFSAAQGSDVMKVVIDCM
jgi:alcohol dehydrogenase